MDYAHVRDGEMQTVDAHLAGTARLCAAFAGQFGEARRGALLGSAHDIGKYSDAFQLRLLANGKKVDHATAGALECAKRSEDAAACCIVGHHGGLPDYGNPRVDPPGAPTCAGRLRKGLRGGIPPYRWAGSLPDPGPRPPLSSGYDLAMWIKLLYSCLVDADYLDTEAFMSGGAVQRGGYDPLPLLLERLEAYIRPWFPGATPLNRSRCAILSQCLEKAAQGRGIYSLTVPTGGGKTVASLAFALKHAVTHGLSRIIYVLPYTSIIEQNAAVFREILGGQNVVEHHSGIRLDADEETNAQNRFQRLAAENWDAPVVVTTAVQFFDSLYSNRPSQCRKLHNLANSVLLFDEAQMIPTCHLLPCVGAISSLAAQFRSTVVLCTATQPVLADLFRQFHPEQQILELCPEAAAGDPNFCRVTYRDGGTLTLAALAEELEGQEQALCIVNTRRAAQELFRLLPPEGRFHLSTLLYPAHRKAVLQTVRERLAQGLPCRVVSTSLIEAGVDVDFPVVYRELAGLDSVAQAAGRCNREGRRPACDSIVTYFRSEIPVPLLQQIPVQAAREALHGGLTPGDPEAIRRYFSALRSLTGDRTDKTGTVKALRDGIEGCMLPFETVAGRFHLIDQETCTVYLPLGGGEALCQALEAGTACREDYRRAGQYSVGVYARHFAALSRAGDLLPLTPDSAILTNLSLYDPETGLSLQADCGKAEFI